MGDPMDVLPGLEKGLSAVDLAPNGLDILKKFGHAPLSGTPLGNFLESPAFSKLRGVNSTLGAVSHFNDLMDADSPQEVTKALADLTADTAKLGTFALKHSPQLVERVGGKLVSKAARAQLAKAAAVETPILEAGLWALTAMSVMLGFGDPETGDRFGNGAKEFGNLAEILAHATDPSWEGSASSAYGERNAEQRERIIQLANLDTALQRIIQTEAQQLEQTSDTLDICSDVLTVCIPAAIALYLIPVIGPEASFAFQVTAVAGVAPIASMMMNMMAAHAMQNAMQVQKQAQGYSKVASKARPGGSPPTAPPGNSSLPKGGDGRKTPDGSGRYPKGSAPGDINTATGGNPNARNMGATTPGSQAAPHSPGQPAGATPHGGTGGAGGPIGTGAPQSPGTGTTHALGGSSAPSAPATPGGSAAPTTSSPGAGSPGGGGAPTIRPAASTASPAGAGSAGGVTPASTSSNPGAAAGPGVQTPGGQSGGRTPSSGAAAGPSVQPGISPAPVGPSSGTGVRAPVAAETETEVDVNVEVRST